MLSSKNLSLNNFFNEQVIVSFLKHLWTFAKQNKFARDNHYSIKEKNKINQYLTDTFEDLFINPQMIMFFNALQILYKKKSDNDIPELELLLLISNNLNITKDSATKLVTKITNSELLGDIDFLDDQYNLIVKNYKLYTIQTFMGELESKIRNNDVPELTDLLDKIYNDKFNKISFIDKRYEPLEDNVEEYLKTINDKTSHLGEPTGLEQLDNIIGGLVSSNFIVIAARPSVGKSAFAINLIAKIFKENACTKSINTKKAVLFVSLEMSNKELTWRFISNVTGIDSKRIQKKDVTTNELSLIEYNTNQIWKKSCVLLSKSSSIGVDDIENIIRKVKLKYKLKIVIVDYIQLMTSYRTNNLNREQEVAKISRKLKLIAMKHNICVIGLSQLSRRIEQRENKEPLLSDLRESGAIEQDADIIIFLYHSTREKFYGKKSETEKLQSSINDNIVSIKIGKNRNGPIGKFQLYFEKRYQQFRAVPLAHEKYAE